jgi:hypothetical protein
LVHAFEINEMLTKDSDSTTDTEDGDEDARPERKEEREERSQALFERRRDFVARGCERMREKIKELSKNNNYPYHLIGNVSSSDTTCT